MRFSYQRDIIYNFIYGVNTHPTAADVFNMVRPQIENISLGTVYRNLSQLMQEQMIHEVNIQGVSHFDGNMDPHQHLFCKKCKTIIDCNFHNNWNVSNLSDALDFSIQKIDIIFSGLCRKCNPN